MTMKDATPENEAFQLIEALLAGQPGLVHTSPAAEASGKQLGAFVAALHQTLVTYLKTLPR
jgi:hypothetical protein